MCWKTSFPSKLVDNFQVVSRADRHGGKRFAKTLAAAVFALSSLVVPPAAAHEPCPAGPFGPGDDLPGSPLVGSSRLNPAGQTIVLVQAGERGIDATTSATNRGTVCTGGDVLEGESDGVPSARRAHAVFAASRSGDATALNERVAADATSGWIVTGGAGARGIQAETDGEMATARATNRGTVVTVGDIYDGTAHFGKPYYRTADGVAAFTDSPSSTGDAIVINERNAAGDEQSGVIEVLARLPQLARDFGEFRHNRDHNYLFSLQPHSISLCSADLAY